MQNHKDRTLLRAVQYYYIDCVFEFTFSGLCLLLAAFFFIQAKIPDGLVSTILMVSFVVIIPLGSIVISRLVNRFKEKITYPRTGYLAYQRPKGARMAVKVGLGLGVSAILGGLVAVIITGSPQSLDWMPGLTAFVFAFVFAWLGYRTSLPRFLLIGFLLLLSGILLSIIGLGNILGLSIFYAIAGLFLLISGTLTFWTYLHRNPQSDGVQHGN